MMQNFLSTEELYEQLRSRESWPIMSHKDIDLRLEGDYKVFLSLMAVEEEERMKKVIETKSSSSKVQYRNYFITLTTVTDDIAPLDRDLNKILNSKMVQCVSYVLGRELTKEGRPHYHVVITTTKYLCLADLRKIKFEGNMNFKPLKTSMDVKRTIDYTTKGERQLQEADQKYFTDKGLQLVERISLIN